MYIVLYRKLLEYTKGEKYFGRKDDLIKEYLYVSKHETFEDEQLAVEFATKSNGVVLIPAELKLSIEKPEKK